MNVKTIASQADYVINSSLIKRAFAINLPWIQENLRTRKLLRSDPQALKSLEEEMELLICAYLAANLNCKCIPLKEFTDRFEMLLLHTSLLLTHGHMRNAASLLGLKITTLCEKMRKHRLNGRQIKLSQWLEKL